MIVFISVPMNGYSPEWIEDTLNRISVNLYKEYGNITIVDGRSSGAAGVKYRDVWLLGKALCNLSVADAAYFANGWQDARGCCVEHLTCEKYGIKILND